MITRSLKQFLLRCFFVARLPLVWIVSMAFRPSPAPAGPHPKRILLVRLDRLGDFVLTLPVIENIKIRYPDAHLTALVRPYLAALAGEIGSIDEVLTYEGVLSTAARCRRSAFDIAIDMVCDYTVRSALVAFFSGVPERIGFSGGFRELLFTKPVEPQLAGRALCQINLDLLAAMDVPATVRVPRLMLRGGNPARGRTVAFHPGGHYPSQRWPAERFADVARKITDAYDVDAVIIGGPEDRETVDDIMAALDPTRVRALLPDMKGLAEALARSTLVICNNSGPLHLAAALGIPTVSMMGPTDPALWRPQGVDQIVIRKDIPCAGCGKGACADHRCMTAITADEVYEAACRILDKTDGITKR